MTSSQYSRPFTLITIYDESEEYQQLKKWTKWVSGRIRRKSLKYLERVRIVLQAFMENEFLEQADIVKKTGISKSTVSRIVKELEEIGVLERISLPIARLDKLRKFRHLVNPKFFDFLDEYITKLSCNYQSNHGSSHSNSSTAKNLRQAHVPNSWVDKITQEERCLGKKWFLQNSRIPAKLDT